MSTHEPAPAPASSYTRPTHLHLAMLKPIRMTRGITARQLSDLTTIPHKRLSLLESLSNNYRAEPWLDEAYLLSRALGTNGIYPLVGDSMLETADLGISPFDDLDVWATDARIPLSLAIRLTRRFGFDDPEQLVVTPLQRQLWEILERSERTPASGYCPWCAANTATGERHLPSCIPHFLYGMRGTRPKESFVGTLPGVRTPGRVRVGSGPGWGLKALRKKWNLTQDQFVKSTGFRNASYYCAIEQGRRPLTIEQANRIAAAFKVDVASLYRKPENDVTPPPVFMDQLRDTDQ